MPELFLYDEKPVEDYIDEPALRTCVRKAVQFAGRERYEEITSDAQHHMAWNRWVRKNRGNHLRDADNNRDGNTVDGLTDYVIKSSLEKNASLDRNTADKVTCAILVELYAGAPLLDEILRAWGWREGILTVPTSRGSDRPEHNSSSPVEKRHAADYVASTYGNGTGQIVYPVNSTRPTLVIKHDENNFPVSVTMPEKEIGIHFKWGVLTNSTIGKSLPIIIPHFVRAQSKSPVSIPCDMPKPPPGHAIPPVCPTLLPRPVTTTIYMSGSHPTPSPGKSSPEGSLLVERSTRPFSSTRQPFYGWVPVPPVNLTSGPESSLNYTDRFNNSAGVGLPRWLWVPMPVDSNSSVAGGVPEFVDGMRRLWACPANTTGPVHMPSFLGAPPQVLYCDDHSTSPSGSSGKFAGPRRSTAPGGLSVPWHPTSVIDDVHGPVHEILSAFDEFEEFLDILDSDGGVTTHGLLSPRSKVHFKKEKIGAIIQTILGTVFKILGQLGDTIAHGKHASKDKPSQQGRRVARGSLGTS